MSFKKWNVKSTLHDNLNFEKSVSLLAKECETTNLAARILHLRGYDNSQMAKAFINPSDFSDPFEIIDMDKATARINAAIDSQEKILICGDYDADGITATFVLYNYLKNVGGDVQYFIPERSDGYGLSVTLIKSAKLAGIQLIITVDNGITCIDEVAFAKENGIDTVITDHHKVPNEMPCAEAVVDPQRSDCTAKGCEVLCGAGVVFKLVCALEDGETEFCMDLYAAIVAVGTIGDIVPLTGENRFIVKRGLESLKTTDNLGLCAIMEKAKIDPQKINSGTVAFAIVPRINAAGRMNCAKNALKLLLCQDEQAAMEMAEQIMEQNIKRKMNEDDILDQILQDLRENPQKKYDRIGVFSGENWHQGVIGIVASRLMERLQKPIILISVEGSEARGSARSFEGFSIYNALSSCKELLEKFGGHNMAAGFSLKSSDVEILKNKLQAYAKETYPAMPLPLLDVDCELSPKDLTIENVKSLEILEPFGKSNPQPVFCIKDVKISDIVSISSGKYTKVKCEKEGQSLEFLVFFRAYNVFEYQKGDVVDIAFEMSVNEFRGDFSITLKAINMQPAKFNFNLFQMSKNIHFSIKRGDEISAANGIKAVPSKEEMTNVYKFIKSNPTLCISDEIIYCRLLSQKINFCRLLIILEILKELKLITKDEFGYKILPYQEKSDYKSSKCFKAVEKYNISIE